MQQLYCRMNRQLKIIVFCIQFFAGGPVFAQCPSNFVRIVGRLNPLCDSSQLDWASWTSVTPTGGTAIVSSQLSVTVTKPSGGLSTTPGMFNPTVFPTQYNVPVNNTSLSNVLSGLFTFCFSSPVLNPQIALSSIGNGNTSVPVVTSAPYVVIWAGPGMAYPNDTTFVGTEGYTIIQFPGVFTCISFNYLVSENYCNIAFGVLDTNCQTFAIPPVCPGNPDTLHAAGAVSYTWAQSPGLNTTTGAIAVANPLQTTTYYVTGTDANNCQASDSFTVQILPSYNDTVTQGICPGGSFNFNGSNYTQAGYYTDHYQTVNACDSLVTLHLFIYPAYNDTTFASICQGSSYSFQNNSYTITGTYTFNYTTVNGCDSVINLILKVNPVYHDTTAAVICQGNSYSFSGNAYSNSGSFTLLYQTVSGCDSDVTLNLTVNPVYSDTQTQNICAGNSYSFNGNSYEQTGYYPALLQTVNGCDSTVTLHLIVNPVYNDTTTAVVCHGNSYLFQGNSYDTTGTYSFNYTTANGCDSNLTLQLKVNPVFADTVTSAICDGQTYALPDGSSATSTGIYNTHLNTTAGCDSLITTRLQVYPTYSQTITDTICGKQTYVLPDGSTVTGGGFFVTRLNTINNCDSIINTQLIVNSEPAWFQAYVTPAAASVYLGKSIVLTANSNQSGPLNYVWLPFDGLSCNDCVTTTFSGNYSTAYTLTVSDTNGCQAHAGITVEVLPDYQVFVPNVFTPNGDGSNDQWQIFGNKQAMKMIAVMVYDRVGEKVFESTDINFAWDGTYKGKPAPAGVYVYQLTIVWLDNVTAEPYKGAVTLLR